MDQERFWTWIEQARTDVTGVLGEDGEAFAKALTRSLVQLPVPEITDFAEEFARLMKEANRWDLWGAAHLIGGGCTEDGFVDFRAGLIASGREWFTRALADPDSLASHPAVVEAAQWNDDNAIFAELATFAASDAYEQVTSEALRLESSYVPIAGEEWDFDDDDEMRHRLPRLSALFLGWPANEGCSC